MLWHTGDGIDFRQVQNLSQNFVGIDWLAGRNLDFVNEARDRGRKSDGGRRIARLPALHQNGRLPLLDGVVVFHRHLQGASRNATTDDRSPPGIYGDLSQRKNTLLKGRFLDELGFDTQIFYTRFIENHRLARTRPLGRQERTSGKEYEE